MGVILDTKEFGFTAGVPAAKPPTVLILGGLGAIVGAAILMAKKRGRR